MGAQYVIVGSGIAGLAAAEALRAHEPCADVVMVSEEPHNFYSRPGLAYLLRGDFHELGVGEEYAEGIIDYLRSVEGAEMAATIREPPEPPEAQRRISLRASSDEVDVSAIART